MLLYVYILEVFLSGDSEQQDMPSQVSTAGLIRMVKQRFLAYAPSNTWPEQMFIAAWCCQLMSQ